MKKEYMVEFKVHNYWTGEDTEDYIEVISGNGNAAKKVAFKKLIDQYKEDGWQVENTSGDFPGEEYEMCFRAYVSEDDTKDLGFFAFSSAERR